MRRETDVESYLTTQTERRGGICKKWVSLGWAGAPDRIVILPGQVWFVEVKAPGRKPSALQRHRIRELRALGHKATWVNSYEDVDRLFGVSPDVILDRLV